MRTRATVAGLTSSAAPMAASVQPGPASPWLAFNRIRAWVSALAGATPRPIMLWSRARSCSDRTTTCRLRTSASCSVGPPEPHEHEGEPPTTQLKADELLVGLTDRVEALGGSSVSAVGRGWDADHRGAATRAGAGGRTLSNALVWSRQARTRVTDLGPSLSWLPTAGPGG